MRCLWPWGAAVLSGVGLALSFAPVRWGGLVWVALVPLVVAVWFGERWGRGEWMRLMGVGHLAGLIYFGGSLHWLLTVTVAGWLALSGYLALYVGIWAIFLGLLARPRVAGGCDEEDVWLSSRRNLWAGVQAASAWAVLEWVRGNLFTGFGWNGLNVALVDNLPILQIAELTGGAGVSFLVVMVNVVSALTVKRLVLEARVGRMRAHWDFSVTVLLVGLCFVFGVRRLFEGAGDRAEVSFAAVQADVPIVEKRDPAMEQEILEIHERLTETALAMNPDLVIWPEAATPQPLFLHQGSWEVVQGIARKHRGDFLLGSVHFDDWGDFNSAVLLTRMAGQAQIYHKVHLVPFGEYVPLRESFPLFAWLAGDLVPDDFDFGPGPVVLEMEARPVKIGPLICFEDTLPYIARGMAQKGAQVFITLTNDAWFLRSAAAMQHRDNSLLRTIEARLPMVRVANSGVTCAIDAYGRETHRLQDAGGSHFLRGVLHGTFLAPVNPVETFYVRHGEVFTVLCGLVSGWGLVFGWVARRRQGVRF